MKNHRHENQVHRMIGVSLTSRKNHTLSPTKMYP
jgi:hypothetical protein